MKHLLFAFLFIPVLMVPIGSDAKNVLDSVCYDICANSCNRHLRSRNRRNCRNSCSNRCTKFVADVKDIGKDIEKTARSIRDAGGKVIDTAENLWNALNDSGEFPARLSNHQTAVASPSIQFSISRDYINSILQNLSKNSLSTNDKKDNNYVQLNNPRISFDPRLNIIVLESGGTIAGDFDKVRGAIKAKAIRVDLAPKVRNTKGQYFLDLFGKITYLDIKDSPPKLDKYVANAAHHVITQDKPLLSIDISEYVNFNKIIYLFGKDKNISFNIVEHSVISTGGSLVISVQVDSKIKGKDA